MQEEGAKVKAKRDKLAQLEAEAKAAEVELAEFRAANPAATASAAKAAESRCLIIADETDWE
jgi:hypothetical protein